MHDIEEQLGKLYEGEPDLAGALTEAQTRWREFRDAECRLRTYDSRGGSAFESYWLECLTALNRDRITRLEYMKDHP